MAIKMSSHRAKPEAALEKLREKIGSECENGGGNGAGENQLIVDHGQAAKNEFAEAACADRSGNRGDADGQDGGYADSRENDENARGSST